MQGIFCLAALECWDWTIKQPVAQLVLSTTEGMLRLKLCLLVKHKRLYVLCIGKYAYPTSMYCVN